MISKFPFPFSFPRALFLSFSEIFPLGFVSFFCSISKFGQRLFASWSFNNYILCAQSWPVNWVIHTRLHKGIFCSLLLRQKKEFSQEVLEEQQQTHRAFPGQHDWLGGVGWWLFVYPSWGSVLCELDLRFYELRGEEVEQSWAGQSGVLWHLFHQMSSVTFVIVKTVPLPFWKQGIFINSGHSTVCVWNLKLYRGKCTWRKGIFKVITVVLMSLHLCGDVDCLQPISNTQLPVVDL